MRSRLLSAFFLLATLSAPLAAHAQGWSGPNGCHLGWSWKHNPPAYCCPPEWRWYIVRNRAYPNQFCQGYKGTVEPYNEEGLLLPPTSRLGALPPAEPTPATSSSRRPTELKAETMPSRR